MKKILAFGEVLFDVIEGQYHLGGASLNVAAHLAKLGNEAYLISAAGNDQLGTSVLETVQQYGIQTNFISENTFPTGTVDVTLKNGQPSYIIHENVAWDYITLSDSKYAEISATNWDCFYFGLLSQRSKTNHETLEKLFAQNHFTEVFFDVNIRQNFYSKEGIEWSLSKATIFKLNDEEIDLISKLLYHEKLEMKTFAQKVATDFQLKLIIITQGADGASVLDGNELIKVEGFPAKVIDTVGAGDSFSSAFLNFYLAGMHVSEAVKIGCKLGALVASSSGAVPSYQIKDIID